MNKTKKRRAPSHPPLSFQTDMTGELCSALEGAAAMCELLIAHARGETDLTEDQLEGVVRGVSRQARDTLRRARGRGPGRQALVPVARADWVRRARQWASLVPLKLDS